MPNQSRTVELQIKLQGVQSLQELETVTSEINNELKNININSKEFTAMGDLAKQANSKVKEVSSSLEGVTSTEKSEAINKMGMALLGAFQGAAGASLLFGEQTSEAMNKAIKAVGGLFAITDSVKKITEAFSAKNISALKSVWKGWMEASAGAKIFGISVKTALISTGIGALVVALGLIVANFDKIKNLVNGTGRELEKNLKTAQANAEVQNAASKSIDAMLAKNKEEAEIMGKHAQYAENLAAAEKQREKALQASITATEAELAVQQNIVNTTKEKRDKHKEAAKQVAILTARLAEEKVALLFNQKVEQGRANQYKLIVNYVDAVNNLLADTKNELIKIQSQEYNRAALYAKQREELGAQIFQIKLYRDNGGFLNKQQEEQLKTLEAQRDALDEQNRIRIRDTKEALAKLKAETKYTDEINRQVSIVEFLNEAYEKISDSNQEQLSYAERKKAMIEFENETYQKIAETRNEIVNFDKKGVEIFDAYFDTYNDLYKLEAERIGIGEDFNKLTEKQQRAYGEQLLAAQKLRQVKQEEFLTQLKNNDALIANLDEQKKAEQDIIDTAQGRIFQLEKEREVLNKKLATNKGNLEAELDLNNKIKEINSQINGVISERTNSAKNITQLDLRQNQLLEDNKSIQGDINKTVAENDAAEKKITYEIKQQIRLTSQLKKFTEDYNEEIQATQELLGASLELIAATYDAKAEGIQREMDAEVARLEEVKRIEDAQKEARDAAEEDSADRKAELMEMLADAEGERYQDILDEIAAQDTAKEDAYKKEIDRQNAAGLAEWTKNKTLMELENQKADYEYKAAKTRKTAAIIDATIQTALAVIKALPNVFLAVATGVLGAVGIATIAAQKLPPKPESITPAPYTPIPYAKGGYTGDGDVNQPAGIVHAGEYVVPQRVMRNPRAIPMVQTLEGMRQRGYAEGGVVTTPNVAAAAQNAIDYDLLGSKVAKALQENPVYVSWTDWRDINSKMQWIGNRASLGKK